MEEYSLDLNPSFHEQLKQEQCFVRYCLKERHSSTQCARMFNLLSESMPRYFADGNFDGSSAFVSYFENIRQVAVASQGWKKALLRGESVENRSGLLRNILDIMRTELMREGIDSIADFTEELQKRAAPFQPQNEWRQCYVMYLGVLSVLYVFEKYRDILDGDLKYGQVEGIMSSSYGAIYLMHVVLVREMVECFPPPGNTKIVERYRMARLKYKLQDIADVTVAFVGRSNIQHRATVVSDMRWVTIVKGVEFRMNDAMRTKHGRFYESFFHPRADIVFCWVSLKELCTPVSRSRNIVSVSSKCGMSVEKA